MLRHLRGFWLGATRSSQRCDAGALEVASDTAPAHASDGAGGGSKERAASRRFRSHVATRSATTPATSGGEPNDASATIGTATALARNSVVHDGTRAAATCPFRPFWRSGRLPYHPRAVLRRLRIDNLVLIRNAELDLAAGLNAITGETGAGKTILAQSIGLLLGGRADAALVGAAASEAYVEAELDTDPPEEL